MQIKPRLPRYLDISLLVLIFAGALMIVYRSVGALDYTWNWQTISNYFFLFDTARGSWVPNLLISGLLTTIRISVWAILLATVIGGAVGIMLRSDYLYLRLLGRTYVELVRNIPPLVLIFLFYFFFSSQIMSLLNVDQFIATRSETALRLLSWFFAEPDRFSAFVSALLTMAIYEGAYIAEIVRAGLDAVPKGQWEAADALGLSRVHKYRLIVLPQAFRVILPALAGQFISTIKDSAIVSVISIQELTFQGMELMSATYLTFETWITITLMYFVLTFSCSMGAGVLEKKLSTYKK